MVKSLAKDFRVIFLHTLNIKKVMWKDIVNSPKQRQGLLSFYKSVIRKQTIIFPEFITKHKYLPGDALTPFDEWFVFFQLRIAILVIGGISVVYANTAFFSKTLKEILKGAWVYDFFDRNFDLTSSMSNSLIRENEKWLVENSLVLIKSDYYLHTVMPSVSNKTNQRVVKTKIGYYAKPHLFVYPVLTTKKRKFTIGYAGGLSERLDYELILSTVKINPELNFIFVGKRYSYVADKNKTKYLDFQKLLSKYPNVTIMENITNIKRQAEIISSFNCGWIPYDLSLDFNKYCLPTKFIEYLAVGIPVISTHLPCLESYGEYVTFISKADDVIGAMTKVWSENSHMKIVERKQFALSHSLGCRYSQVRDVVESLASKQN
ncbi:hypothetical protein KBD45_03965 [Candidatus Dojkabacteria bacterium]|nr:hypothetical protein [Candidatus Dojkabacteria bacterium]